VDGDIYRKKKASHPPVLEAKNKKEPIIIVRGKKPNEKRVVLPRQ
jgi:hypothetical protein